MLIHALAPVTIAAVALTACSSRTVPLGQTANTGTSEAIAPGAPCRDAGLLYCEPVTGSLVLFCGAVANNAVELDAHTLASVFQCPSGVPCSVDTGSTSVECGPLGSDQQSYALEGAPCTTDQMDACSFDATKTLRCEAGVWQVTKMCSGANCGLRQPGQAGCDADAGKGCTVCLGDD